MRRLLTHSDGRLKTGRVAVMIFFLLIGSLAVLFKLSRPVDQVLLVVRHVFEPEKKPADNKIPKPRPREDIVSKPVKAAAQPQKDVTPPAAEPPPADKTNEKSNPRPLATIATKPSAVIKSESPQTDDLPVQKPEPKQINPGKPVTATQGKLLPELKSKDKDQSITLAKSATFPDRSDQPVQPQSFEVQPQGELQIDIASGMKQLYDQKNERQASEEKQQDESLALQTTNLPVFAEQKDGRPSKAKQSAGPVGFDADSNPSDQSITVSSDQYLTLFNNWRKVGESRKKKGKILLRVENLRNAFSLFQMKAVAVVGNRRFFDLSDGSRLPEAALEDFSATVFRVQQPWQKWGDALSAAGIRQSETIEVRYYMYDFIKNAIYERAEQAFVYSIQEGLIEKDTPPSGVDILGRAFVIKKQGGGQFAVFVPISLDTESGKKIAIDPACFRDQGDVKKLLAAGLL
jgi:hypothetical protein